MSSPSDYDTAPDVIEPVETCSAVPRSEGRDKISVLFLSLIAKTLYCTHEKKQNNLNTVTGKREKEQTLCFRKMILHNLSNY